ncbi:MAG: InlB B-repeat-containing protein, partial [Oscillospiraceae bacterium]|nr:InlB B-repeat-containing protein [Oscillospiraceae bacterium]
IAAPGEKVKVNSFFGFQTVTHGTSIAAPHVTGAASLLWQKDTSKSNEFIRQLLAHSSKNIENTNDCGLLDVSYALEIYDEFSIDTGNIPENMADPETFEEIDDDENYVEGRWGQSGHTDMVEPNYYEAAVARVLKMGAIYPDLARKDPNTSFGNTEWHGWAGGNYFASYKFITKIALHLGDYPNDKAGIANISRPSGLTTARADRIRSIFNGKAKKWEDIEGEKWHDALNRTDSDTNIGTVNYDGASSSKKKEFRLAFISGLAVHTVTDVFAHSAFAPYNIDNYTHALPGNTAAPNPANTGYDPAKPEKTIGSSSIHRLSHSTHYTSDPAKHATTIAGADITNAVPSRYKAAAVTAEKIINRCYGEENTGTCSQFNGAWSSHNPQSAPRFKLLNLKEHAEAFAATPPTAIPKVSYAENKRTVTFRDWDGKVLKDQTVNTGSTATAPSNPSRTGYSFSKWSSTGYTNIQQNRMITAQYTANTYTVKFHANGGSGTMSNQSHTYGSSKALTSNAFTRDGRSFYRWSRNANGTGTTYTNGQSVSNLTATNNGVIDLYAQWQSNPSYTVILNNQNATYARSTDFTATLNSTSISPAIILPWRTGYAFDGYWTSSSGGNRVISSAGGLVANVSGYTNAARQWIKTTTPTTLYARWTLHNYTITLHRPDADTPGSASFAVNYNSASITSLTVPQRDGYSFDGYWSTATQGTGVRVVSPAGALVASAPLYTNANRQWIRAGTTTLYARWKSDTQTTITAEAGTGGTISGLASDGYYSHDAPVALTANANTGYTFAGWYEGGQMVSTNPSYSFSATDNRSLHALFTPDNGTFTVYFQKHANWVAPKYSIGHNTPANTIEMTDDGDGWYRQTFTDTVSLAFYGGVFPDPDGRHKWIPAAGSFISCNKDTWVYSDGTVTNVQPASRTITVRFQRPDAWTAHGAPFAYFHDDNSYAPKSFPGNRMTDIGGGWYEISVQGMTAAKVVFNVGSTYAQIPAKTNPNTPGLDVSIYEDSEFSAEGGRSGASGTRGGSSTVYSRTSSKWKINLASETIDHDGFSVAAYSINGGKSWKKYALPTAQADLSKLFDKGLELWLAAELDARGNPVVSRSIIKFPKINARPKIKKTSLRPHYGRKTWELKTKDGQMITSEYQWAEILDESADGSSNTWQNAAGKEFAIQSSVNTKTYLFRTLPTVNGDTYIPAGKPIKVKPKTFGKRTPRYTLKKGTLKLSRGTTYSYQAKGEDVTADLTAKAELDTAELDSGTKISVWKTETGKSPPSEQQEITV